jgi:hypothetical protein
MRSMDLKWVNSDRQAVRENPQIAAAMLFVPAALPLSTALCEMQCDTPQSPLEHAAKSLPAHSEVLRLVWSSLAKYGAPAGGRRFLI